MNFNVDRMLNQANLRIQLAIAQITLDAKTAIGIRLESLIEEQYGVRKVDWAYKRALHDHNVKLMHCLPSAWKLTQLWKDGIVLAAKT